MTDYSLWWTRKHWQNSSSYSRSLWIEQVKDFGIPNSMLNNKWWRKRDLSRSKEYYVRISLDKYIQNLRYKDKHGWCKGRNWF